ncbi:AAA family ATPase [Brevibacillus borstelensis]|uniref:AAA family ATPase n=1 Tax=Brevibacillus borstelensis TaxID=45462 RepID=UPI0030C3A410
MEKIQWLREMAAKHPEDAQAHFWLGKELAENGLWLEAISSYSTGLACCDHDELRNDLIRELSQATQKLQQNPGGSAAAASAVQENSSANKAENVTPLMKRPETGYIKDDKEFADQRDDQEREDRGNVEGNLEEADDVDSDSEDDDHDGRQWTGSGRQNHYSYKVKNHPGLHIIDGGQREKKEELPALRKVTFEDVAGLQELKKTIRLRIISPFFNQGLFSKFRKKTGGGVLLYGPPGCGKTFVARATAGECKANFIPVHITDILDPYIGVSEQNLKAMFDKARHNKPSIMFFDEIDTIGYNRSKSSSNYMRGVIDTFLSEMEGIDTSTDQVLIIGATNLPWDVDNALKRPGRFDRLVFVAPPDLEARQQIFALKLRGRFAEGIDPHWLAKHTEFFSGADIENVCERAAEIVLEDILETGVERPIMMRDLESVLSEVKPTTLDWLRTAKNYVKYANQSGLYNDVEAYLRKFGRQI